VGQIKGYFHNIFTERKRAKGSSKVKHKKGKRQPAKEKASRFEKKERLL
jgi:hypothetical protein